MIDNQYFANSLYLILLRGDWGLEIEKVKNIL